MAKIRSEGFEPPYPAWSPQLPDTPSYVQAQVAIQSPSGERDDHLFDGPLRRLLADGDLRHAERVDATHEHAARFAPEMRLLLGHEVIVAPAGGARARYVGCHSDTGLMPYFPAHP
jgi:hypothetical protein